MARKQYGEQNGKNPSTVSSASSLTDRFRQGKATEQPDWGRMEPELLWRVIQRCTQDDGAVMFGYSRDGGAYSIKVYDGGEPEKAYFHTDAETIDFLQFLLEA
jgi:hypothetical protein